MVICKFFQTGNCRFGTKCANEHFDVKQLIKTEIEAALQGRQWPLSSFGPFKEKPCFPNFIDDQSFEEIRFLCYEAKKQNYFPNFEQQFNQQVMEAQNKMKTLLTLNREIVDIVTNIYDSNYESGQQQKPQNFTAVNPNPFGAISGTNSQQSSNLFGNQQQQVNPFSKATAQSGFGNNSAGIFGGSTSTQTSASGIVGQSSFGNGNSIFGGTANPQQLQPSIFTSPIGQPQQQNAFGGFAQQSQSSNIFSQPAQQQQPASSIFGGQIQGQTQQQFGTNIFAQPTQQTPLQTNLFGAAPTGGNIFTQANQQQQPTGFGQQTNEPQFPALQTQSLFGAPQPNPQQNIFATQLQSQQQQQQPQLQQQQPQANVFAQQQQQQPNQVVPSQPQQSLFGGLNQQQPQKFNQITTPQNQNIFAQNQSTVIQHPPFPQFQPSANSGQFRIGIYSKMEDLSQEDIQAFKADNFALGNIPCKPPPREFC